MSIISILDIARTALSTQQYGIEVTGHNIANVNTPEYSRQRPVIVAEDPLKRGGLLLGCGADVSSVIRATDQLVENRLMLEKSSMLSSQEMENYMRIFEGLFNENSDTSISSLLSDFWNSWHDISNDPSGVPQRIALYEQSSLLAEQLNILSQDLTQIETDLTGAVKTGIESINRLTGEIANLNRQIITVESDGNTANDLRDKRNARISELYGYLDVQTFEQDNGAFTVTTSRGGILVNGTENFDLKLGGANGNGVLWENSSGTSVDITNYVTNGKLGGWLEMRDGIVAKYKLDLDAVAKEFAWSVNEQHSQGVGLKFFDAAVTGTYKTDSSGLLATLAYGDKIDYTKDFKMWTYDSGETLPVPVDVDMGISTANPSYTNNFASVNSYYTIEVTQGGTVNTDGIQLRWSKNGGAWTSETILATDIDVVIDGSTLGFAAGDVLVAGNTLTVNTAVAAGTPAPVVMTPTGTANNILDTYTFTVATGSGGTIGTDSIQIGWSNSVTSGTFTLDASTTTVTVDGMELPFTSGYLFAGDAFTITTDANGTPTATLPSDWHWTLDSFVSQFNRQTPRVTASKTSANALTFTPYTAGTDRELKNYSYSGGATAANTTVTVNNYDMLTASTPAGTPFTVTQTPAIENTTDTIAAQTASVTIINPAEADESVSGIILEWDQPTTSWSVQNDGGFTGGIVIGGTNLADEVDLQLGGSGTDDITVTVTGAGAGVDAETVTFDINTDNWRVSNVPGAYTLADGDIGGDNDGFDIDLNGDGSSDIAVSFATALTADGIVAFDIAAAAGTYSFGFSDDTAQDSGLTAALGINTFYQGSSAGSIGINTVLSNKDYIAAAQIDAGTGDRAAGNNSNALAIADLQYTDTVIAQVTVDRINGNSVGSVTATIENYYHATIGSIGVTSSSIVRAKEFNEIMVNNLNAVRDAVSAVSLDEEMANLIKFQHAYAAAAKIINVADEMYVALLQVK
ncbi:MAG: flagellar hook-associated protein FlgK [Desulfobacteraceae bacterium]|nr:flagellar hook-associated protein FlgK [Desulfobacteraceae bacterium]